jgi:hypothetical protein
MIAAIWGRVRSLPGWLWGLLFGALSIAAVYLTGRRSGRVQERLRRIVGDADALRAREVELKAAHEDARQQAQKQIEAAIAEEVDARDEPVTAKQIDAIGKELEAWPDD